MCLDHQDGDTYHAVCRQNIYFLYFIHSINRYLFSSKPCVGDISEITHVLKKLGGDETTEKIGGLGELPKKESLFLLGENHERFQEKVTVKLSFE